MRGKIIQYNGADGSGTIVAEGRQYKFALAAWRGDNAPAVNKTVEITLEGDAVTAVTLVGDDVLLKEKAAELGGKLGSAWNKAAASVQARNAANEEEAMPGGVAVATAPAMAALRDKPIVGSIVERYGMAIPIAWVLLLIGTLALNTAAQSMDAFGAHRVGLAVSMFNLSTIMAPFGGGGGVVKALLILAYLSIGVPVVWRDRRAWLTLLLPLIAVIWAFADVLYVKGKADTQGGGFYSFDFGFGFWLSLIMAIIIAALAVKRFMASS